MTAFVEPGILHPSWFGTTSRGREGAASTGRMTRGESEMELSSQEPGRGESVDTSRPLPLELAGAGMTSLL